MRISPNNTRYWGWEHDYEKITTVVSIRDGGLVQREDTTRMPRLSQPQRGKYRLMVYDPFLPQVSDALLVLEPKAKDDLRISQGGFIHRCWKTSNDSVESSSYS